MVDSPVIENRGKESTWETVQDAASEGLVKDADRKNSIQRPPSIVIDEETRCEVGENGDSSVREGEALQQGRRSLPKSLSDSRNRHSLKFIWYGLPKAAKASLVLSLVGSILLIAYAIVSVSLRQEDEEAHVATTIIILSIFTFLATVDAIIYENTLQLVSSIILSVLMMLRVLWFISTRPTDSKFLPLKVIWGALICVVVIVYIICALVSCRQFGWRLYSRLGVDFRRPGAKRVQRMAFIANLFNALLKLDFTFLVILCALGIDISVENRESINVSIFTISICMFFVNLGISILGLITARSSSRRRWLIFFNIAMPVSYAGPTAVIVLYMTSSVDVANAATSTIVAGCVFMVVRTALWWTHYLISKDAHMFVGGGLRVTLRRDAWALSSSSSSSSLLTPDNGTEHAPEGLSLQKKEPILSPLFEGAWLGKPTPRNPKKTRYFQLSDDGGTLRWGWNKFVRMYYVQEVDYSEEDLSITLTFLLDPDLVLVFPNDSKFYAWKDGLEKLIVILLSPSVSGTTRHVCLSDAADEMDSSEKGIISTLGVTLNKAFVAPLSDSYMRISNRSLSVDQLRRRQKMASYLFKKEPGTPKSPLSWLLGKKSTSDDLASPTVKMISVGTQTSLHDFLMLEDHVEDTGQLYVTDEEKNSDIAAQYAAMLNGSNFMDSSSTMIQNDESPQTSAVSTLGSRMRSISSPTSMPLDRRPTSSLEMMMDNSPTTSSMSAFAVSVDVIEFSSLSIGKLLGSGSEGDVHAAWYLESPVAVKRFNRLEDASYEAGMYLAIGLHDNVVSLRALCQHNDTIYLIMEYCPRGTLDSMLHYSAPSQWDPVKLLPLIRAIARAMHHLHSRNILHRDLKPANIFIGHGHTMKVGDFGMACIVCSDNYAKAQIQKSRVNEEFIKNADDILELVGSIQYTAPELINPTLRAHGDVLDWSKKLDVWSFGITLWEILERRRPFEGLDEVSIQSLWLNSPYQARLPSLKIPDQGSPQKLKVMRSLSDLIDDCTRLDPNSRPTFHDILKRSAAILWDNQKEKHWSNDNVQNGSILVL